MTRSTSYFDKAVTTYEGRDVVMAIEYLGKGSHYVSDINEPHHAIINMVQYLYAFGTEVGIY